MKGYETSGAVVALPQFHFQGTQIKVHLQLKLFYPQILYILPAVERW